MRIITCTPRVLTPEEAERALRRGLALDPDRASTIRTIERTPTGRRGGPKRLALLIDAVWPGRAVDLSVQFLDNPEEELRRHILAHMNAWNATANVRFRETRGTGQVRISRLDRPEAMAGYWSYVGTQILGIKEDQPTMNLDSFTMETPESEFIRVVRHETGHTLGFEHEHMRKELVDRIDVAKAIAYFDENQGWDAQETRDQVLTPLEERSIMGTTAADPLSIMCYQLPGKIMKDRKAIKGGNDINEKDRAFVARIYPKDPQPTDTARPAARPVADSAAVQPRAADRSKGTAPAFQLMILDDPMNEKMGSVSPKAEKGKQQAPNRPKYGRILATYAGARITSPVRLFADKGEEPTPFGRIIGMHERIKSYTNLNKGSLPPDADLIAFGKDLFNVLFPGDVRRLYDEARARNGNQKLDLVLTSMIPWIAEKPWEFAYDKDRRSFLATEDVHFIRNAMTAVPADMNVAGDGPLRILVASAQPVGFGQLSIAQESAMIARGFKPLIDEGLAEVETLARATPDALHDLLSTGSFDVVHFIGHGIFREKQQQGALVFNNGRGGPIELGEREVREIFCKRGVELLFLNACQSGSGGRADFNKGLAQSLVAHGMPALVANQYSVLDSSATSFAQRFYWALAKGMGIGRAACEARIALNYAMNGESIDWAVPVVYARDPSMTLRTPSATDHQATVSAMAQRRDEVQRPVRVAVWDIDGVFPGLEGTLKRMHDQQSTFGFELTRLSAPIDTWDKTDPAGDGTIYLDAEKLGDRFAQKAAELGVDILACVTRHWMRDSDTLNLYGWWPDTLVPPVLLFSFAGLSGIPVEGRDTDRAFANLMVSALAGYLGDLGTHERGAKDCPLSFNEDRKISEIIGSQKFDKACRAKLQSAIPAQLPALDALLKTFNQ